MRRRPRCIEPCLLFFACASAVAGSVGDPYGTAALTAPASNACCAISNLSRFLQGCENNRTCFGAKGGRNETACTVIRRARLQRRDLPQSGLHPRQSLREELGQVGLALSLVTGSRRLNGILRRATRARTASVADAC
jgi:hypothetical protein